MICKAFGITRQAYHAARKREAETLLRQQQARAIVEQARGEISPRIGTRKLYREFYAAFRRLKLGRDKLFELLRRCGLLVPRRRRLLSITHWMHKLRTFDNLISGLRPSASNEVWVADMTYVPTDEGFAYASIITDAYSRKILGYHLSATLEAAGPLAALKMAMRGAGDLRGLIHHSDRGVQYCCQDYVSMLERHGCRVSMTAGGNPCDNALAERVNGTLKNEYMLGYGFRTLEQARRALSQAVRLYNQIRPHLSLAYRKPSQVHNDGLRSAA